MIVMEIVLLVCAGLVVLRVLVGDSMPYGSQGEKDRQD